MIFYFIIGRKFFIIRYDATVFQHKSEPVLQMLMFFSLPLQSFALLDVVILFKYLFINKFLIYFFNYEVFFFFIILIQFPLSSYTCKRERFWNCGSLAGRRQLDRYTIMGHWLGPGNTLGFRSRLLVRLSSRQSKMINRD